MIVVHANPAMAHQVRIAECVTAGFRRHGEPSEITADPVAGADIHVVIGPHYALRYWQHHPRLLWLDRCFFADTAEWTSAGWGYEGRRYFCRDCPPDRWHSLAWIVREQPLKTTGNIVVFGDFGDTIRAHERIAHYGANAYRPHPADPDLTDCPVPQWRGGLEGVLTRTRTAVGGSSTVLVAAALAGCHILTDDVDHIALWRREKPQSWGYDLAYTQWNDDEYRDGTAWDWLRNAYPQRDDAMDGLAADRTADPHGSEGVPQTR